MISQMLPAGRERFFRRALFSLCCLLLLASFIPSAHAQTANLSGLVADPSGAIVRGADITFTNEQTNVVSRTKTNNDGIYSLPYVQPGQYTLTVEASGFAGYRQTAITVGTAQDLALNVRLKVGDTSQVVTVDGSGNGVGTTNDSPAVSLTVSREFVESMPLNGESFQDLIQLAPGTVSSQSGYYSIDGQRTDRNNYTVDGVSANLGGYNNDSTQTYGSGLAGASPLQTMLGTTQSLTSIDSLQEFTIQTSGYTAEYGRTPGGQVQFTTLSGTNDIHGSLFEYLRNTAFDANSYKNNYFGDPKTAEHQNDFGGTIGGPLIVPKLYNGKDRTFYFFNYEGLRLLLPAFESEYVPTQAFRNWASPNVQPFLNGEPLPSKNSPGNQDGCTIPDPITGQPTACDALFNYGYSYPERLDNISLRVDQNLSKKLHAFVRYADTPSSQIQGAELVNRQAINTHSWTAGLTASIYNNLLDDVRFNYSHDGEESIHSLAPVGGGIPWARNLLIPAALDNPYAGGEPIIEVPGTSLNFHSPIEGFGTVQHQYQIIDSLTWTRGKHSLKFGGDWRLLTPTFAIGAYGNITELTSLAAIQQGYATSVSVSAQAPGQPVFDNLSLYAQDHWKIIPKLSVDYGLRWEFNPPPGPSNGFYPLALTSNDLATTQVAPPGTSPYKTNYHSFAPRLGFAWNVVPSQNHALTVRGGFGIFFDTAQSAGAQAYTASYPFAVKRPTQTNVPLPLSSTALAPPSLDTPLLPPYGEIYTTDPGLTLPYTEQWNLSVDEMLNARNTLTVSYVGNNDRKLIFTQYFRSLPGNPDFAGGLVLTNNGSQSSYNALQIQDTGRIATGLDLVGSFTWAHALDNASNDFAYYGALYGNSDYDPRRVLNLALNYQMPTYGESHWVQAVTHGWLLANRFSAQSGYPITNLWQSRVVLPDGMDNEYYPDLVRGVPIYLHGRAADFGGKPAPGNWRLNPAAFAAVPVVGGIPIRQGTLGRNYVRNPPFWVLNTAVQRSFPIAERVRLNLRAEAFNIFNHPSLSQPDSALSDTTFGQLVGGTTLIGSSNPFYSMGAARSLQLSLHLQF